ncbi:MAG TPA: alkaline phosphatase family protein [Candidatus Cybelea sp.]
MQCSPRSSRHFAIAVLAFCLPACNGNNGLTTNVPAVSLPSQSLAQGQPAFGQMHQDRFHHHGSSGKIQHVVIIIQENRSFNNLFYGFPGATTATYGYNTSGQKITLQPVDLKTSWDVDHSSTAFFDSCNGTGSIPGTKCRMNGFDKEGWQCGTAGFSSCPNSNPPYSYVPNSETKPYFDMGEQYVVADHMYPSNLDESSFVSHQYIIAAQSEAAVNFPSIWGCQGGSSNIIYEIGPQRQVPDGHEEVCFSNTSLGQEADKAGVSWAYYAVSLSGSFSDVWSAYQANKYVYSGSDWSKDVISPPSQFLTDVSNGKLRQITWITPTYANSDHAGGNTTNGPSWVASLVNVIGQSKYWDSTAIFIFWDDPGGWFDPEPPPYKDYDGLGIRVPLIIVSPYAKQGYVSHVQYEHGSILRFVEDQFGLGRLSATDTRATSPEKDCFNFTKPPRKFQAIPAVLGKDYFLRQPPDNRLPDNQ